MGNFEIASRVSNDIRSLALKAVKELSPSDPAYHVARRRTICPIDYMRYAEFDAILRDLQLTPNMTVLDVSSPQWLSIYLANKFPDCEFHYINIVDNELDPYRDIAAALGIKNLTYKKVDVRDMEFAENTFDRVISVSVIEHIYPAEDGDLNALREIERVIKPEGYLLLTIPYKSKSNIVYMDGPVHERTDKKRNFFAREYDKLTFGKLVERSELSLDEPWFISEKKGIFSVDYYVWGPGKENFIARNIVKSRRVLEIILRKSFDEALANHYLIVSREATGRLVNISAKLKKAGNT